MLIFIFGPVANFADQSLCCPFRQNDFLGLGPLGGARGQAPNAIWAFHGWCQI